MAQISDVNLWGGLTPVQIAQLGVTGISGLDQGGSVGDPSGGYTFYNGKWVPTSSLPDSYYNPPTGTAYVPPAGQGPSTATYTQAPANEPVAPMRQQAQAGGAAILPMIAQVLAMMNAGPRVTQLPTPTNWLGPNTGAGLGMGGLFGGGLGGGTGGGQADVISRALGLMPWLGGGGLNPFSGGGQAPALSRIASPLWGLSGMRRREDQL